MTVEIKRFDELTTKELYEILQLRSEVFVVEQDCVYQDIDGKDEQALHIIGALKGKIVAYSRCFPPGVYFEEPAIGRVVVRKSERKKAYGHQILITSIDAIKRSFGNGRIRLSAQTYLIQFYESHGFQQVGEGYLEDGIPHIAMLRAEDNEETTKTLLTEE